MSLGELSVRVGVHGEPLSGIEEFHEKHAVIAVARDVLRAKPFTRFTGDCVGKQATIIQSRHTHRCVASHTRR